MSLTAGTQLGPYQVVGLIGQGGMGEVYRARDTKLGRDVALKVLPDLFADDPERLARFQREARVLASLNHPNIASIYGLEESEGVRALVLELVEGPTLAERIAQGAIPVEEALTIAKQIADALEAAHEAGVIHRDLKPANVKVKDDGVVKVLDFGLAKALEADAGSDPSESPTLTAAATRMGVIMGTAAYMSPEQAKGKVVDKRADVWAFGCVLYEVLTGRRVFEGGDISEVLAGVIKTEPNWDALPADMTPALRTYLRRCLQKDPRQRVRDIGDVRLAMDGAFETTVSVPTTEAVAPQPARWRQAPPWVAGIVVGGTITGVAVWSLTRLEAIPPAPTMRFDLTAPAQPLALTTQQPDVTISPDGVYVVYPSGAAFGESVLMVRPLGELTGRPLEATASPLAVSPFISPDNDWVGFYDFDARTLRRVSMLGGPAIPIGELSGQGYLQGASWGADDTIIFGTNDPSGLWRIPVGGGEPEELTTPKAELGEVNHAWPEILPGGESVLFTILPVGDAIETATIAVLNLATGEERLLIPGGSFPRYSPTGHIVYGIDGTLRAVPFDLDRLEVTGNPVPVLDGVITKGSGAANFGVSQDGSLVYLSGAASAGGLRTLTWVDREGREEPLGVEARLYADPAVSPDGTRVAVRVQDPDNTDIWIWSLAGQTLTRLTVDAAVDNAPLWTPDSARVVFRSIREGGGLFSKAADGTGEVERLMESPNGPFAFSWAADGRLVFAEGTSGQFNIGMLTVEGEPNQELLLDSEFSERRPAVSPDGRWLAYESNESGQLEIYVRPFPNVDDGKWPISTDGGVEPQWSPDGEELFYLAPGNLMATQIETEPTFSWSTPERALSTSGYALPDSAHQYDISPDGRFLMLKWATAETTDGEGLPELIFVQNWFEDLKARVPVP